ncbi:GOLD domain protein [Aspergillus oryzae]|uniref:GOLD domain protein n=1 Tax=Aspergillus oryzae TaxID=5062 RepID=A0A1S9DJF0_ASPOZ|nr:GOLD domain protein [Aspergillus oryzae]
MRFSATTLLITALGWMTAVTAHTIQLKAHSRECYHESLHKDDKMTVSFQVGDREFGGSGNLEIDFWVEDPLNNRQYYKQAISSEDYSFVAHADGKYVYCFSNEGWTSNSKEVSFNVHGIVYVPESEMPQDPLEVEVRRLSEALAQVKDEQSYIVVRERVHRNTAESTNARVKWWSIFQLAVLIGEGIFQVWWLKRFFETSTCVPNPARFPILAPLGSSNICPLGSKERWELRAMPFGCNVSTFTFLTAVVSVLGTLATVALGYFVLWATKRPRQSWAQGKLGGGYTDWSAWEGRGVLRRRGVRTVGDVEGNSERTPLLDGD